MQCNTGKSYAECALKIVRMRSSSNYRERNSKSCPPGRISKESLVSMLGNKKFVRPKAVPESEVLMDQITSVLEESGGNLNVAASRLGLTKSSLLRKMIGNEEGVPGYDETGPSGSTRRYLEKNFGSWNVSGFDPDKREACLRTKSSVTLSVTIPDQSFQKF